MSGVPQDACVVQGQGQLVLHKLKPGMLQPRPGEKYHVVPSSDVNVGYRWFVMLIMLVNLHEYYSS